MSAHVNATTAAVSALKLLAADADTQLGLFPSYVAAAEEIALQLESARMLLEQEAEREGVPRWFLRDVQGLDDVLDTLSSPSEAGFWSQEGLRSDIRWHRLRLTGRKILERLGVPSGNPSMDDLFSRVDEPE